MSERKSDTDATQKMPQVVPQVEEELEEIDPEATLARDDWESTVIRPRVAAV